MYVTDLYAITPFSESLFSTITAPAPSEKIIESLSTLSTTLDNVSAPITKHLSAASALIKL